MPLPTDRSLVLASFVLLLPFMLTISTIVCPFDFSAGSTRAAQHAASLAQAVDATVWLFHVRPISPIPMPRGEVPQIAVTTQEETESLRQELETVANTFRRPGLRLHTFVSVQAGPVAPHINSFADEKNADLIVMASHGRTGIRRALLGSVAEEVLRRATRPLLVVPGPLPDHEPKSESPSYQV